MSVSSSEPQDLPKQEPAPEPESAHVTPRVEAPGPVQSTSLFYSAGGMLLTMRPHQWVKNTFVLAPVVFAKEIFDTGLLIRAGMGFGVFCLLAGAVYTMNDLVDVEADRAHPVKCRRPIPSGRVPLRVARLLAGILVLVGLGFATTLGWAFFAVSLGYFVQNIAYSFRLKKIAYIDVVLIASGFVLRVMAGGFATKIQVSAYLLLCTALLALFLGFGKRRHELSAAAANAGKQRSALEAYSPRGLDISLLLTGLSTVATYVAYTLDATTRAFFRTDNLWLSTVLVAAGVWRFLFIVRNRLRSESPTQEMLKDGPFVGIVLLWVGAVLWIVYNLRPG